MEIPGFLETQIREGKVVLFLGAGASMEARDRHGNRPPCAKELGALLADRFLGGKYRERPLSQIAEYAISEADLTTVQEFLRETFSVFEPSPSHLLIPLFSWSGLATTNYDRIIERAYELTPAAVQIPKPFIENGDRVDESLRDPRSVMLLKLHGCITRTANRLCPLILTADQYIDHRQGRSRIFDHLQDWGYEHPLVFVGHSLEDQDLRTVLLELTRMTETRPRYYTITPDADDIQARFWETKRVTLINGTLHDFLSALDSAIPASFRKLSTVMDRPSLPIAERFKVTGTSLSTACAQFLQTDVEYVRSVTTTAAVDPRDFFKGTNPGWSPIEQDLDVRRQLADTILSDNFLINESEHEEQVEFILIKGHAGAGKSVLLRRIAWDAARDYNLLCLFVRRNGLVNTAVLQELINLCRERIYLFVDGAADRVRELQLLASNIGPDGRHLTVVLAERINEWNVSCTELSPLVSSEYELKYLSSKEIDALLALLEKHRALGTLEHLDTERRRAAFSERAGRQLLVALHEATLGEPFEEIIENEFRTIRPLEAQHIYLTICVLNRLNVAVRAGIIARIHGVPFEGFRQRLFAPLERIVQTEYDGVIRDYTYQARHPHIAQIVFERILRTQEDRYDAYIRCLRELNIDYASDRKAFWQMVRGRSVIDLFPNHELARRIYDIASGKAADDPHLLHQIGLYELNRPNGNLQNSGDLLSRAAALAPWDFAIKHSIAEHRLRCADLARTPLERERFLKEASEISMSLKSRRSQHTFGHHTLVKIGLRRLRDLLDRQESGQLDAEVEQAVKETERDLSEGLQQFPGDPYLLSAESDLAQLLSDSRRVLDALQRAFAANPRSYTIATRLARCYQQQSDLDTAGSILKTALDANPTERRLHYAFAKLLMTIGNTPGDQLVYHLQRSFTPGDKNYDAQLLFARQLFVKGERDNAKRAFRDLATVRIGAEVRDALLYPLDQMFRGRVVRIEASYCFIARDGFNDWIYARRTNIEETLWKVLGLGTRLVFRIAFSFKGPGAFNIELESSLELK